MGDDIKISKIAVNLGDDEELKLEEKIENSVMEPPQLERGKFYHLYSLRNPWWYKTSSPPPPGMGC